MDVSQGDTESGEQGAGVAGGGLRADTPSGFPDLASVAVGLFVRRRSREQSVTFRVFVILLSNKILILCFSFKS